MADLTREEIEAKRDAAMAALEAVTSGQSYTIDGQTLMRADIPGIKTMIGLWERKLINFDDLAAGDQAGVIETKWR
jgi:hypothetical protein